MAANVIVDAGALIALLSRRDRHHAWAAAQAAERSLPWTTCEAVLSEAFHLLGPTGRPPLSTLLRRGAIVSSFNFAAEITRVLALMEKYGDVPMSMADACLVRMTEIAADPVLLTTDADFHVYRRHGRQAIPYVSP